MVGYVEVNPPTTIPTNLSSTLNRPELLMIPFDDSIWQHSRLCLNAIKSTSMLQWMQNRAVQLCCGLRKHDHVTEFYHRLWWVIVFIVPPVYHQFRCILLDLILQFALVEFLHIVPAHLHILLTLLCFVWVIINVFFRYKTIQWWNTLPSSVTSSINSPFYAYVDAVLWHTFFD